MFSGLLTVGIAKLMRQAADILSSAPAMQIRQLEAYQAMAKSANSKVIFMPTSNVNLNNQLSSSSSATPGPSTSANHNEHEDSLQQVLNAHISSEL
jgi:erythrocyte band 7 integral membrane protein